MYVVTTQRPSPDRHITLRWPDFPTDAVVAATLVQMPGSAFCHSSERYDQDGEFISHARADVAVLLAEVVRLRAMQRASAVATEPDVIESVGQGITPLSRLVRRLEDRSRRKVVASRCFARPGEPGGRT